MINYAYQLFLERPFSKLAAFRVILMAFHTAVHVRVKGLEFPGFLIVIEDEEAGGLLFSYDKLLGVKEPTKIKQRAFDGRLSCRSLAQRKISSGDH